MKPPIRLIPGNNNKNSLKEILQQIQNEMPLQIQIRKEMAKLTMEQYKAYLAEGFSPEQALYLCKDLFK